MRSYPIWNDVTACIYASSKSYGVRRDGEVSVKVGTSARNSHHFVKHSTSCRDIEGGKEFRFYVDGVCIKRCQVKNGIKTDLEPVEA